MKRAVRYFSAAFLLLAFVAGFAATRARPLYSQVVLRYPAYDLSPDSPLIDVLWAKPEAVWASADAIVDCRIVDIAADVDGPEYNRPFTVRVGNVIAGEDPGREFRVYSDYKHILKPYIPRVGDRLILLLKYNIRAVSEYREENHMDDLPMLFGAPQFYITEGDYVLQVYQNDEINMKLDGEDADKLIGLISAKWEAAHQ